ncbi:hypothetical protein F442_19570 [Phytophthora nicotianae P10297]|uniref:Uncharacterized protein n=1 Tax=Phytophthora nicotianae P10297 TaxID=1317064 RepID=W2Y9X9_PHYNI|nr:hypothetical protein F442_19570 [Phytophthora nicotianae P10297]
MPGYSRFYALFFLHGLYNQLGGRYCARGRKRKFLIKRAHPKVLVNKFWMTATNSGHLDNHH